MNGIKSLRVQPQTGKVTPNVGGDAKAPKTEGELDIEARGDGVRVSTPLGALELKEGSLELPGAKVSVFERDGARQVSIETRGAQGTQEPLLFTLGVDGFAQVKSFGAGMGEALKFIEDGVLAAIDARTQKPVAGTVIASRGTQIDALQALEGAALAKAPELSEEQWAVREKAVLQKLLADPVKSYGELRQRLEEKGPMAPFPELQPVVSRLLLKLRDVGDQVKDDPALARHRQIAMTKLVHAGLDFRVDTKEYPYERPFEAPYPYKQTLDAIKGAIELFDAIAAKDKSQNALPLYHADRYQYYWDAMTLDGRTLVFPTLESLGFEDLIRTRAVPFGFIGVATETVFVDRHRNSPLDFFIHDVNHVRRMTGYADRELEKRGVRGKGSDAEMKVYAEWQRFIDDKLMPMLTVKGKKGEDNMLAHMVRLIVFEILHESAVAPTAESMLSNLTRPEGAPDPFEHMLPPGAGQVKLDGKSIEEIRTATGNLDSGVEASGYPTGNITVRYFMDRAVVLLGNVYNKMAFGFFDEFNDPKGYVAQLKDRTPENVARGAQLLFELLGQKPPPFDELVRQAKSQAGSEELFQAYPKTEGVPDKA